MAGAFPKERTMKRRTLKANGHFKIERNIPIPARRKYPFSEMKPGDSFLLHNARRSTVNARAVGFAKRKNPPWRFSIRNTPKGCRCWRVS
jgi:hypothetical protein